MKAPTDTELDKYAKRLFEQDTAYLLLRRGYIDMQMMLTYLQGEITFRELGEEAVRVMRMKEFLLKKRNLLAQQPLETTAAGS